MGVLNSYQKIIKKVNGSSTVYETVFKDFRTILMGNEPDKLDRFLEKHSNGCLAAFCNGIKKDIAPSRMRYPIQLFKAFIYPKFRKNHNQMISHNCFISLFQVNL